MNRKELTKTFMIIELYMSTWYKAVCAGAALVTGKRLILTLNTLA